MESIELKRESRKCITKFKVEKGFIINRISPGAIKVERIIRNCIKMLKHEEQNKYAVKRRIWRLVFCKRKNRGQCILFELSPNNVNNLTYQDYINVTVDYAKILDTQEEREKFIKERLVLPEEYDISYLLNSISDDITLQNKGMPPEVNEEPVIEEEVKEQPLIELDMTAYPDRQNEIEQLKEEIEGLKNIIALINNSNRLDNLGLIRPIAIKNKFDIRDILILEYYFNKKSILYLSSFFGISPIYLSVFFSQKETHNLCYEIENEFRSGVSNSLLYHTVY